MVVFNFFFLGGGFTHGNLGETTPNFDPWFLDAVSKDREFFWTPHEVIKSTKKTWKIVKVPGWNTSHPCTTVFLYREFHYQFIWISKYFKTIYLIFSLGIPMFSWTRLEVPLFFGTWFAYTTTFATGCLYFNRGERGKGMVLSPPDVQGAVRFMAGILRRNVD